ncbi:hypothetical protein DICPUDRAFT_98031 [Dictyostelium purpureum]|uniref:Dihydroxyacetone kinase n=1 Tax=Dictyostelium purpureum TaxID=5786 RepID=F0ZM09_DICPU|nr:uncharacterized protein DICPUDRAFT_98031 [Dictyostelium purpureum]EGC35029.1 hypothetical protein DICPUDRAFT_98031 [Dictyostelium purpureum]|eukprot:XP_003288457.1 hypothetical protein DICPUDRAFT_98031 [Dictyostelium purpureum]
MKKILNQNNNVVQDMIEGWTLSNEHMLKLDGLNVVVRSDCQERKDKYVSLISGGGSGHEPSHCGFIGLLSAGVCGEVFASPNPKQVLEAIKAVCGTKGCILIVKNYTGDRLNFGIAQMMAQTEYGLRVEMIIVDDDVSSILQNYDHLVEKGGDLSVTFKSIQNRRGIAGTVLVHKILGALSQQGKSIDEIIEFYNKFISPSSSLRLNTMGVGLSSCTIPAIGKPSFSLDDDEMELGLGIHGEPGILKTKMDTSKNISKSLIDNILKILPNDYKQLIVLINNLGSTTNMELAVIAGDVLNYLTEKGFIIERLIQGTLMTSLEMAGISITLLSFDDKESGIVDLIDFGTSAPAWPTNSVSRPNITKSRSLQYNKKEDSHQMNYENLRSIKVSDETGKVIKNMVLFSCKALLENSNLLTDLDSRVGDGDIGLTLERAANNILQFIEIIPFSQPCYAFRKISTVLQDTLGGSSGPFYSIFFLKLSNVLYEESRKDQNSISLEAWSKALCEAANAIGILGKSKVGDCTMLDSLVPAVESVQKSIKETRDSFNLKNTIKLAANAAHNGANSTIEMMAKKGRSSYLGERSINVMDPGAAAISIIIQSFKNLENIV